MASNSLAPTRRFRISWRPALVSKYHFPLRFTIGIGKGKSSFPIVRRARFGFFASVATEFFSFAFAANATARFLSPTESSELTRSVLSGPRISFMTGTSIDCAALIRLSAACCGVSNSFCFTCGVAAASVLAASTECKARATKPDIRIAEARIFDEVVMFDFLFIGSSDLNCLLIYRVLHRRLFCHRRRHRHGLLLLLLFCHRRRRRRLSCYCHPGCSRL